ncbi:MAG: B12-binding domain-containing radical SAM protein [Caldimonas sp.]|uniref:B12-binding domain-containing radical SAM protein n=1 Tax=Caldimonas taiwanensis TaxID=307483 RepID=UPI0009FEBA0B|nr:radical SAM protein [Caldimonas taiwanensis]GIX23192.1 MAG: B12-binding domain-containing radical SAM protein [Caldimonas sp.]
MRVAIISVFTDYHRKGRHHRGGLQPQIGPLIAGLLPDWCDVEIVNDTWDDPDWSKTYDLVFLSCVHADWDRARQISHYFRRRGARTVLGGSMAGTYPHLCAPYFDAVVIGDPEDTVPRVVEDARANRLQPVYRSAGYFPDRVPVPRIAPVAHKQVFPLSVEATRGCPYACDFCALTAVGTRHALRPVHTVVRDILAGQAALRQAGVAGWKQRLIVFYDNNLAGHLRWFRELCVALRPLDVLWGACLTFNVIANRELLKLMYDCGCRAVFVGLETFNPDTLADISKPQNNIGKMAQAIAQSRDEGILVIAGLIVSPLHDDVAYLRSLPDHLDACGLHVPSFVSFETPIPGTPFFDRMAASAEPRFLPHANLYDFSAYTLVLRPHKAPLEAFLTAYQDTMRRIYAPWRRVAKLADDLPRLLRRGSWTAAALDVADMCVTRFDPVPGRSFMAGTDTLPPETVPFAADDFDSEAQRLDICSPTLVTDEHGHVLPWWRRHDKVFHPQPLRKMAVTA